MYSSDRSSLRQYESWIDFAMRQAWTGSRNIVVVKERDECKAQSADGLLSLQTSCS